jgi:hypothetical protein
LGKLLAKLPQSIKHKVGEIELYGTKAHKFKVHVAPPAAAVVAVSFKEFLKEDAALHFNGQVKYTTTQRPPAEEKQFSAAGKARAYLEAKAKTMEPTATSKCSWHPDWTLTVIATGGARVVGTVEADASIAWSSEGLPSVSHPRWHSSSLPPSSRHEGPCVDPVSQVT